MKERRHYYRLDTDLKASFREEGAAESTPARIVDISVVGAYLRPEKRVRAGKKIELSFELPQAPKSAIICQAKVVWSAEFDGYHSGVEFIDIKRIDRYKIAGLIKSALRTMIYRK